jgi:hypothetical protein
LTLMQANDPLVCHQEEVRSHIRLFGKMKSTVLQTRQGKPVKKTEKTKTRAILIGKYEISDDKVVFFGLSGILKKQWVTRGEIQFSEISTVESTGNVAHIVCDNKHYEYVHAVKTQSFRELQDKFLAYLAKKRTIEENYQKNNVLKTDLVGVLKASIPTVDMCFDVLLAMNRKRTNWKLLEETTGKLESIIFFSGQILTPFTADLTKISLSIKSQVPKLIIVSAIELLKSVYAYFDALKPADHLVENAINIDNIKNVILAYYIVNDVLLAKLTGQTVEDKEISALEKSVLAFSNKSVIKISVDELKASLVSVGADDLVVHDVRAMFKVQLKNY